NWGTVGFFNFNVVSFIFGNPVVHRGIFCAVGVAGCYQIISLKGIRSRFTK
ncbi:MAG: DUF378 domain-containing protein, partial [Chlamydiales bacterium]